MLLTEFQHVDTIEEMEKENDTIYLAALASGEKLGSITIKQLIEKFGGGKNIWEGSANNLCKEGVPKNIIEAIEERRREINLDTFWEKVSASGLKVLNYQDNNYPKLLKEIADPPIVLYLKGELYPEAVMIAVVGSRACSGYGRRMTERISGALSKSGAVVVSGLALGIDGIAHRAALQFGGKTIAVLAHGLDIVYPGTHRLLAKEILEKDGALISEYPPGVLPLRHHFLLRNRIIAGMSLGTVVIEAGEKSGALTTARCALEDGRAVFAVPGDAERPQSTGVNNLVKQGAVPITYGEGVLEELNLPVKRDEEIILSNLDKDESKIYQILGREPIYIDQIANLVKLDMIKVNIAISSLELKGLVKNVGGMMFVLS